MYRERDEHRGCIMYVWKASRLRQAAAEYWGRELDAYTPDHGSATLLIIELRCPKVPI